MRPSGRYGRQARRKFASRSTAIRSAAPGRTSTFSNRCAKRSRAGKRRDPSAWIWLVSPSLPPRPHGSRPPVTPALCWRAIGHHGMDQGRLIAAGAGAALSKRTGRLSRPPGATASLFCARPASWRSALFKRHLPHRWHRSQSFPAPGGDDTAATSPHRRPRDDGGSDRCRTGDALRDFARAWS
jgi:hypothetical protein